MERGREARRRKDERRSGCGVMHCYMSGWKVAEVRHLDNENMERSVGTESCTRKVSPQGQAHSHLRDPTEWATYLFLLRFPEAVAHTHTVK